MGPALTHYVRTGDSSALTNPFKVFGDYGKSGMAAHLAGLLLILAGLFLIFSGK